MTKFVTFLSLIQTKEQKMYMQIYCWLFEFSYQHYILNDNNRLQCKRCFPAVTPVWHVLTAITVFTCGSDGGVLHQLTLSWAAWHHLLFLTFSLLLHTFTYMWWQNLGKTGWHAVVTPPTKKKRNIKNSICQGDRSSCILSVLKIEFKSILPIKKITEHK